MIFFEPGRIATMNHRCVAHLYNFIRYSAMHMQEAQSIALSVESYVRLDSDVPHLKGVAHLALIAIHEKSYIAAHQMNGMRRNDV